MSSEKFCPIWGTPAEFEPTNGDDYSIVNSPRAGGKYSITGTAEAIVDHWGNREKILLTSWIIEQHRLGVDMPKITADTLKDIKKHKTLSVHDRADNLLRYLDQKSDRLGSVVEFDIYAAHENNSELLAWTSSEKISEVLTLAEYCAKKEWVELREAQQAIGSIQYEVMLVPDGYARLAELDGINTNSSKCFVAMWFDTSLDDVYENGIAPAIREAGYAPMRIDKKEYNGGVTDEIIAEIKRSKFIIADFTSDEDKPRGGVYYEAGFAHGLNIPVIYTCREDRIGGVHFDTKHLNHIVWETPQDLKEKLNNRISATIGDGPDKKI
jgi:hypothetical protein